MSTTDPNANPTTQPPAQPTVPPANPQAETDSAAGGEPWRATGPRRLVRTPDDRVIAGVCGGLARHLGMDPTLLRVLVVVITVLGAGSVVIAYLVAWVIVPKGVPVTDWATEAAAGGPSSEQPVTSPR